MRKILRDGLEQIVDDGSKITVSTTPDGHVIESWVSKGKRVFFANLRDSVYCAHGDSIAQAIGDAIWKDPSRRPSMESLVEEIRPAIKTRKINVREFQLLTGACESGCRSFLEDKGMSLSVEMTLDEFMPIGGEWAQKLKSVILGEDSSE